MGQKPANTSTAVRQRKGKKVQVADTPEMSLTICAPFIERCPMQLGSWDPDGDSATCYAWFFFRKFAAHRASPPIIRPIPPGTERRLTRPDDARRFAKLAPAPLFDANP